MTKELEFVAESGVPIPPGRHRNDSKERRLERFIETLELEQSVVLPWDYCGSYVSLQHRLRSEKASYHIIRRTLVKNESFRVWKIARPADDELRDGNRTRNGEA